MLSSFAIAVGATLVIWWLVRGRYVSLGGRLGLAVLALGVALLGARHVQAGILGGYPDDSFWDLGLGGRAGVLMISALGLAAVFLVLAWKSRFFQGWAWGSGVVMDFVVGLVIYAVLFSMSPQVYYTLYQMIFPDLPTQIVVRHLFSPRLVDIVRLEAGGSMSDHLAGVALWAVVPFTLWCHGRR